MTATNTPTPRGRRSRLRAAAKWSARWLGLTGVALIVVAWVASMWGWSALHTDLGRLSVGRGTIQFDDQGEYATAWRDWVPMWKSDPTSGIAVLDLGDAAISMRWETFAWQPESWWIDRTDLKPLRDAWILTIPLWLPLAACAIPCGLAWWLHRRRYGPGRCASCGYSLTGLAPTAVCPECGTPSLPVHRPKA